ncbi:bacteriophage lysis protein [Cedecea neteri]|uniref:Bacteriophage lysis protein n=1 Tax=Cedecea neteri TaxID=158822 RepID=A0AAN0VRH4_9ENTR|nr:lysis protein [Cedecea neteri]AIR59124.1 bacteriophage lysis protein [Cedecea neteri]
MKPVTTIVLTVFALLIASSWWFQQRYTLQKQRAETALQQLAQQKNELQNLVRRQQAIAELDAHYSEELAHARFTIENLQRDVAAGTKRLRVNATCQAVPGSTAASRLDDAATPGLTDAAQRDYFRLRERIETSNKQLAGLQEYIRNQCLN